MNYFKARQRQIDMRWDYTCWRDGHTWPVGYCAGWHEYSDTERSRFSITDEWLATLEAHKDKFHSNGHPTAEEACACYKDYQLDHHLRFGTNTNTQHKCEVCSNWTSKIAVIQGNHIISLCDIHATREEVAKLYKVVESWES